MFNWSETTTVLLIVIVAFAVLVWGYNRARAYGKAGILSWLQSVVLMAPWLVFFGLFAAGIYVNLVGVLFLIIASAAFYIYLGKRLREEGENLIGSEKVAQRLQNQEIADSSAPEQSSSLSDEMTR
ncbi:MAG TPA: site-2 protease family protein, partial [Cyanothece sp. UBA12306]|nr:site-2 protease family protein [Cyanothece sp. UBA12306]